MEKKVAVPVENGILCAHFGHCEKFYIATVEEGTIKNEKEITPPEHQPGLYPKWIKAQGVACVIAGGMGESAQRLFKNEEIELYMGVPVKAPIELIKDYIQGVLRSGVNSCNHHHEDNK
jgi:predicted Fe-Mo cluster-binding NifX family protein